MKLDQKQGIKRLVIYFFYDKDGVVDRYIPYMLDDVVKNCSELAVVCNGKLTEEGRQIFDNYADTVIIRENKGFDVWAYKTALDHYGWDKLVEYDEIIMMNFTIMGPVYPFAEMFAEMDAKDLDFWGITKFHKHPDNPYNVVYGYIPEHIQSHFIAVRQPMIKSREYQKYWNERPEIRNYEDAVGKHEAIFTKYFNDAGFAWDVYVDSTDLTGFCYYPLIDDPVRLIRDKRCPIFKRRSFFLEYVSYLDKTSGGQAKELLNYFKAEDKYDVGLIWENLLRTNHMEDIKNAANLNYILPKKVLRGIPAQRKVALVIHSYFEDLIDYCFDYALSMPEYSDIFITVSSESKKKILEDKFKNGPWNQVQVILVENKGRDVGAFLAGAAPYILEYDYVCFVHDKKVRQLDEGIKGFSFSERCFQNVLGSKIFVQNVLDLFENEQYLGMLCPPPPNHADFYPTSGYIWGPNYENTCLLAKKLNLRVPISKEKNPVAPIGSVFWFRPIAMKALLSYGWKYDDFPPEPSGFDGTILHAIERIYPFVAQNAGYYSAWVMSDDYAQTEWNNLQYMLQNINTKLFEIFGVCAYRGVLYNLEGLQKHGSIGAHTIITRLKLKIKNITPQPIWYALRRVYRAVFKKQ